MNYKDLEVWKKAIGLATEIYQVTSGFPEEEKFGLVSQMRRAAVSIASNIAEGAARQSKKEFLQFLSLAAGSTSELNTQVTIASNIEMGNMPKLKALGDELDRIARMLQGLIRSVKERS
jgi:four helix bundle protein